MLFRKKIEPRCSYCARGGRANDHEVICAKKGIVPAESHCGAFRYDPSCGDVFCAKIFVPRSPLPSPEGASGRT